MTKVITVTLFALGVFGKSINLVSNLDTGLRSGFHTAVTYSGQACSGEVLKAVVNFGCGGECHRVDNGISILLSQEDVGDPKPTADLFSDSNCENKIAHAGIFKGEHTGCTTFSEPYDSFFLYFDC